ncbi:MAG: hypothetical protein LBC68_01555 [Prevotellaceae bacterium]|nr:hypothetical protein [Prevotellaceae bacterium]
MKRRKDILSKPNNYQLNYSVRNYRSVENNILMHKHARSSGGFSNQ